MLHRDKSWSFTDPYVEGSFWTSSTLSYAIRTLPETSNRRKILLLLVSTWSVQLLPVESGRNSSSFKSERLWLIVRQYSPAKSYIQAHKDEGFIAHVCRELSISPCGRTSHFLTSMANAITERNCVGVTIMNESKFGPSLLANTHQSHWNATSVYLWYETTYSAAYAHQQELNGAAYEQASLKPIASIGSASKLAHFSEPYLLSDYLSSSRTTARI